MWEMPSELPFAQLCLPTPSGLYTCLSHKTVSPGLELERFWDAELKASGHQNSAAAADRWGRQVPVGRKKRQRLLALHRSGNYMAGRKSTPPHPAHHGHYRWMCQSALERRLCPDAILQDPWWFSHKANSGAEKQLSQVHGIDGGRQ